MLITLDTLRADRLGAYGDPLAHTPNLDAFAARAALFREASTTVPLTLPAHASILSGLLPHRHGLRDNSGATLDASVPLVAEALRDAGYATAAFVGAYVLHERFGLARGFDVYGDDFDAAALASATTVSSVERPAEDVVRDAIAWWKSVGAEEKSTQPRFMWVHLFDAHRPYDPSPEWSGDPYRGEVAGLDAALGPLLESLGSETAIVIASDHGESLWDGGELEHGLLLNRSSIRVPLLIRPPGGLEGLQDAPPRPAVARPESWRPRRDLGPSGLELAPVPDAPRGARVVEVPVSLIDIAPTLLDFAGLACAHCDGRSLRPSVEGGALETRPVYSETVYAARHFGWAPAFLARGGDRLLVRDPEARVIDPVGDPWGQHPLADPVPALAAFLDAHAIGWQTTEEPLLEVHTRTQLEALGYVTAVVEVDPHEARPRAADRVEVTHRLYRAQAKMVSEPSQAMAELEALVTIEPQLVDAWFSIAQLKVAVGQTKAAVSALDSIFVHAPQHVAAAQLKLELLKGQARYADALALVTRLREAAPTSLQWIQHEVDLYGRSGDAAAVLRIATEGLALAPDDAYLMKMLQLARQTLGIDEAATSKEGAS